MSSEKSKRALLEKAFRLGFEYERNYGGCSQSVLAAIQDVFSLEDVVHSKQQLVWLEEFPK